MEIADRYVVLEEVLCIVLLIQKLVISRGLNLANIWRATTPTTLFPLASFSSFTSVENCAPLKVDDKTSAALKKIHLQAAGSSYQNIRYYPKYENFIFLRGFSVGTEDTPMASFANLHDLKNLI